MVRNIAAHHHRDLDQWPVTAVMSRPAVAVHRSVTMSQALQALTVAGLRHLAVVDGEGRCVGLLSDRMVAAAWAVNPMSFPVLQIATALGSLQPVITANMTVGDAARMMRHCEVDAVVVIGDDRRPVGVLTAGDLVAVLAKPIR